MMEKLNFDGRSTTPYAPANQLVKCSYEGCEHMGMVITKAHCRIHHEMEREEVLAKYGYPHIVGFKKGALMR